MRHFDYQLTLTLPATGHAQQGTHAALVKESLEIADSPLSYSRHYRIDPLARHEPWATAARWTPEEEDSGCDAA